MTSPYLDHIRSPRRIIENLIAAREVELAKTTNADQQQRAERDLRFLWGELARIGNPGHSEGSGEALDNEIAALQGLPTHELKIAWRQLHRSEPPRCMSRDLLIRALAYRMQERTHGGLAPATKRKLRSLVAEIEARGTTVFDPGVVLKPGARLVREWAGQTHTVTVLADGFDYDGERYPSLTKIAAEITGAHWSGPRFFGIGKMRTRPVAGAESADA